MDEKQDKISRRDAVAGIAVTVALTSPALAQAPARERVMSRPDFEALLKRISNWGRWGAADEMGAVNLITPARRRRALALVRDGECYSMAQIGRAHV